MESNQKIDNKELVDAIRNMIINDTEENKKNMFMVIPNAQFIAPITYVDNSDVVYDGTNNGERPFTLNLLSNESIGKTMFPVFTDEDEFKKGTNQNFESYIVTNVRTYTEIFSNPQMEGKIDGIVINPFGMSMMLDKQFFLDAQMSGAMQEGMTARTFEENTKFSFGIPAKQPTDMLNALSEYLGFREDIQKAYYVLMAVNEEQPKPLIVVDYKGNDPKSMFDGIGRIAKPFLKGMEIGMATYDNEMIKDATKSVEPFYHRG